MSRESRPNLLQRVALRMALRVVGAITPSQQINAALNQLFAMSIGDRHPATLDQQMANKSWVFAANRGIAGRAVRAQPILEIKKRQQAGKMPTATAVYDHPFLDLLDQPNLDLTGKLFHWQQILQLNTAGRCYVLVEPTVLQLSGGNDKYKDLFGDETRILSSLSRMTLLEPERVRPFSALGRRAAAFEYFDLYGGHGIYPAAPATYAQREDWKKSPQPFVVRIFMPSPDTWNGQSVTEAADWAINTSFGLGQMWQNQLKNGLHAGLIFYLQKRGMGEVERFEKAVAIVKAGIGKAGEPLILPEETVKVEPSPLNMKDLQYESLGDYSRRETLSVLGSSDAMVGITEHANRACYSADTECLTDRGWLMHYELQPDDRIAVYDADRHVVRYEVPRHIFRYQHDGDMVLFKSPETRPGVRAGQQRGSVDMLVTPNHRMLVRHTQNRLWCVMRADELERYTQAQSWKVLCAAPLEAPDPEPMTFGPEQRHPAGFTIPVSTWARFLGLLLAEGHWAQHRKKTFGRLKDGTRRKEYETHVWHVSVSQSQIANPEKVQAIDALVAELPVPPSRYVDADGAVRWQFHSKALVEHLLAHAGKNAQTKHVPKYVRAWPAWAQRLVLDWTLVGDGSRVGGKQVADSAPVGVVSRIGWRTWTLGSTSKSLCDGSRDVALAAGLRSRPTRVQYEAHGNRNTFYATSLSENAEAMLPVSERVPYTGTVWCVETSTGFFVTRRNGYVAIQGNSFDTMERVFALGTIDPLNDLISDAYNAYVLPLYPGQSTTTWYEVRYGSAAATDEVVQTQVLTLRAGGSIITPNEARAEINKPPVPSGDTLREPKGFGPGGGDSGGFGSEPPKPPGEEQPEPSTPHGTPQSLAGKNASDKTSQPSAMPQLQRSAPCGCAEHGRGDSHDRNPHGRGRRVRRIQVGHPLAVLHDPSERRNKLRAMDQDRYRMESRLRRVLAPVFARWRDAASQATAAHHARTDPAESITDRVTWRQELQSAYAPWATTEAKQIVLRALRDYGMSEEEISGLSDEAMRRLEAVVARRAREFADQVSTTQEGLIGDALAGGAAQEIAKSEYAGLVAGTFPSLDDARMRLIAQTETTITTGASVFHAARAIEDSLGKSEQDTSGQPGATGVDGNAGSMAEGAADTDATNAQSDQETGTDQVGLMWLSMRDDKVRDSHRAADGQVVPTGEPFKLDGCDALYPGDDETCDDPSELISCRCDAVVVPLDHDEGWDQADQGWKSGDRQMATVLKELRSLQGVLADLRATPAPDPEAEERAVAEREEARQRELREAEAREDRRMLKLVALLRDTRAPRTAMKLEYDKDGAPVRVVPEDAEPAPEGDPNG